MKQFYQHKTTQLKKHPVQQKSAFSDLNFNFASVLWKTARRYCNRQKMKVDTKLYNTAFLKTRKLPAQTSGSDWVGKSQKKGTDGPWVSYRAV